MKKSRTMNVRLLLIILFIILTGMILAACGSTRGQAGDAEQAVAGCAEYPQKNIDFIVSSSPGGGFDMWARMIAPFIEKHLPNEVDVVVRNVTGGGGLVALRQFVTGEADGSQIQILEPATPISQQLLTDEVQFDLREFTWLGRINKDSLLVLVGGTSDIDSIEDLKKAAPIKNAVSKPLPQESLTYDVALEVDYATVRHEGANEARLSVMRGDTDANITSLESNLDDIQSGDLRPILFLGMDKPKEGGPGYPEVKDVPTIVDIGYPELATAVESHRLIAAPPNTPACMSEVLEKAVQNALADPEFVVQVKKTERTLAPLDGSATADLVNELHNTFSTHKNVLVEAAEESGAANP